MSLPTDSKSRKEHPIARGCLDYFPDAIAEVAHVSLVGNRQHNAGQPMHWDRTKSSDHADCITRHLIERGTIDTDGLRHSAKVAWRALALLQEELEATKTTPIGPVSLGEYAAAHPLTEEDLEAQVAAGLKAAFPINPFEEKLVAMGCPPAVAKVIVGGMSHHNTFASPWVYISGPMRGYVDFNFPAFDVAREKLIARGFNVISPADIDRASGTVYDGNDLTPFVLRDFWALYFLRKSDDLNGIVLLDGWKDSIGACAEEGLARWLGLKFYDL